jgi:hypothetical protein
MEKMRNAYKTLVGKHEGKNHLEDLGVDGSVMILREIGLEGVGWIHLAQDTDRLRAVVNTVMNLSSFVMGGEFCD